MWLCTEMACIETKDTKGKVKPISIRPDVVESRHCMHDGQKYKKGDSRCAKRDNLFVLMPDLHCRHFWSDGLAIASGGPLYSGPSLSVCLSLCLSH